MKLSIKKIEELLQDESKKIICTRDYKNVYFEQSYELNQAQRKSLLNLVHCFPKEYYDRTENTFSSIDETYMIV